MTTDTATLPMTPAQTAILETITRHRTEWPLSASEIFARCDDLENIAAVHTALHVLHRRGLIVRESCTPEKGKPYYVYRAPSVLADADAPPIEAEWPDALENRPTKPFGPEYITALAAEPAASVAADDDAGLNALADYLAADLAAEAKAPDPVLDAIEALGRQLTVPEWTGSDIRRMRALATVIGEQFSPDLCAWLASVAHRMRVEDVP